MAVARSLLGEPKVVMLDEPTAALGVAQTAQVLTLIKRLRERGLGVIVISHNLADVFEVADRIVVLRLGREAGDFDADDTTEEQVVARDHRRRGRSEHGRGADVERWERARRRTATARPAGDRRASPRATCCGASLQGDLASLRVLLGLAVIWIIFQIARTTASSPPST